MKRFYALFAALVTVLGLLFVNVGTAQANTQSVAHCHFGAAGSSQAPLRVIYNGSFGMNGLARINCESGEVSEGVPILNQRVTGQFLWAKLQVQSAVDGQWYTRAEDDGSRTSEGVLDVQLYGNCANKLTRNWRILMQYASADRYGSGDPFMEVTSPTVLEGPKSMSGCG